MMKSLLFKLLFIGLAVAVTGCSPQKGDDCGFVQNVYGQRISWKRQLPLQVYVNSSVPAQLKPAIHRAAATWEKNAGQKIFEIIEESSSSSASPNMPSRDRKNGIYFLSNWESDRQSEQGRTSVYWAGDEIQEADVRINAANFGYYDQDPKNIVRITKSSNSSDGYNFEALMLHELGHFLGLKHREADGTVMATHLAPYNDRVSLSQTDAESVQCEYK